MTQPEERLPTNPERVEAFANFFKRYMSVSTIVAAALPIPVTALHLIPTLPFQTQELSVYAPLFCFLVLAFIFYSRHALAGWMFGQLFLAPGRSLLSTVRLKQLLIGGLPLVLILAAFGAVMYYRYRLIGITPGEAPIAEMQPGEVDQLDQIWLMILYIAIFIAAEAAFVLMAIKEYLQDYLELQDIDLIEGSGRPPSG